MVTLWLTTAFVVQSAIWAYALRLDDATAALHSHYAVSSDHNGTKEDQDFLFQKPTRSDSRRHKLADLPDVQDKFVAFAKMAPFVPHAAATSLGAFFGKLVYRVDLSLDLSREASALSRGLVVAAVEAFQGTGSWDRVALLASDLERALDDAPAPTPVILRESHVEFVDREIRALLRPLAGDARSAIWRALLHAVRHYLPSGEKWPTLGRALDAADDALAHGAFLNFPNATRSIDAILQATGTGSHYTGIITWAVGALEAAAQDVQTPRTLPELAGAARLGPAAGARGIARGLGGKLQGRDALGDDPPVQGGRPGALGSALRRSCEHGKAAAGPL